MTNEGGIRFNFLFSLTFSPTSFSPFKIRKSGAGNRYVRFNDHECCSAVVQTVIAGEGGTDFRRPDGRFEAATSGEFSQFLLLLTAD